MNSSQVYRETTHNLLLDEVLARVAQSPDAPALRAGGVALSFAGLLGAVHNQMSMLAAAGIVPDTLVAFAAHRAPDTYALMLAILASGAAYLPLDPSQPSERLNGMLGDAQPDLLIADHALHARLDWDGNWLDSAVTASPQRMDVKPSGRLAYVLFTSGSTGRPKGVAMRSSALAGLLAWQRAHKRLGRAARTLQFAPLTFDVSFQEILGTLAAGGTLIVPAEGVRRDPWALLELLGKERVERLFLPYVALNALAEAALDRPESIPTSLVDVITAGEQLRITPALRAFFRALPGAVLHNQYGPTEAHVVTAHELSGNPAAWPDLPPIGTPLPHARLRIEAQAQAAGEGELLIGGACLAEGYAGHPELTAQRFIELDGARWYRSGDRVRRNRAGELEYLGRLDEQIKIAGHRVEPAEVEVVLGRHARVGQAVVVAESHCADHRLVAHVVPRDACDDAQLLRTQLADYCAALLPEYLRPQSFALHARLPITASGKVDRRALRAERATSPPAWDDARIPLRAQLLRLWQQLLDAPQLAAGDNLFDAGARSLTVVHALTELRRRGHVLSVAQVYEHPSAAAQAALLAGMPAMSARTVAEHERGARQRDALAQFARGART